MQQDIIIEIKSLDMDGRGVGHLQNEDGTQGKVIFVEGALPGERVSFQSYRKKPKWEAGVMTTLHSESSLRVKPKCDYFGTCGGCQWQHIDYERQLDFKRHMVAACLSDCGGFDAPPVLPTLAAPAPFGYRNHGRFSIGRRHRELGFTTHFRHRFMRIDRCPIMHPRINDVLAASQGLAQGHQLAVRFGERTGDMIVQPRQESADLPFASGQEALEEELLGRRYRISAAAFFQVNTLQAERLVDTVRSALDPRSDDVLLDLYCGVGVFGLTLAPLVRRVIGVEESAAALKDARHNARDLDNVEFLAGRTEEVLTTIHEPVTVAIVDPPRIGCRPAALEALLGLTLRRLVYVSCDASTLARDLRVLVDGGFTLQYVQPVDMFPQTYHVETVSLLTK